MVKSQFDGREISFLRFGRSSSFGNQERPVGSFARRQLKTGATLVFDESYFPIFAFQCVCLPGRLGNAALTAGHAPPPYSLARIFWAMTLAASTLFPTMRKSMLTMTSPLRNISVEPMGPT